MTFGFLSFLFSLLSFSSSLSVFSFLFVFLPFPPPFFSQLFFSHSGLLCECRAGRNERHASPKLARTEEGRGAWTFFFFFGYNHHRHPNPSTGIQVAAAGLLLLLLLWSEGLPKLASRLVTAVPFTCCRACRATLFFVPVGWSKTRTAFL